MAEAVSANQSRGGFFKRGWPSASRGGGRLSTVAFVLAVLTPKCPLCGVVYCGVASATGLAVLPEFQGVFWTMAALLSAVVGVQAVQAIRRETYLGIGASATGLVLVLLGKTWTTAPDWMAYAGLALMLLGAVLPERGFGAGRRECDGRVGIPAGIARSFGTAGPR